jgi:hypothetical protein
MTVIELDDNLAAALRAKADAQHLALEDWFRLLAGLPADHCDAERRQAAVAHIREIRKRAKPDPEGWTIRDYIDRDRR